MVRETMLPLLDRLRRLLNDVDRVVFQDSELQDALDETRQQVSYEPLVPVETRTPSGYAVYVYLATVAPWETDAVLVDGGWQTLTPAEADPLTGRWRFAAHQPPPVFISGNVYDLYAAAVALLEQWAQREALSFDVRVDGQQLARSQKTTALLQLAETYRRHVRPVTVGMRRSDVV